MVLNAEEKSKKIITLSLRVTKSCTLQMGIQIFWNRSIIEAHITENTENAR